MISIQTPLCATAALLLLLSSIVSAISNLTFTPALTPGLNRAGVDGLVPNRIVRLTYGHDAGFANVDVNLTFPAVVLENVGDVSDVTCNGEGVEVRFDTAQILDRSAASWRLLEKGGSQLIFITNHHNGGCEPEGERGFYLADAAQYDDTTNVAKILAKRSDIGSLVSNFNLTLQASPDASTATTTTKQDIELNKTGFPLSGSHSIPPGTQLNVTTDPSSSSLTATVNEAYLSDNLTEFTLDLTASFAACLNLTLGFTGPLTQSLPWPVAPLVLSAIDIPGILNLGPALSWTVGLEVGVVVETAAAVDLWARAEVPGARLHLDLLRANASTWEEYGDDDDDDEGSRGGRGAGRGPRAGGILGGVLDLSSGVEAVPKLVNELRRTEEAPEKGLGNNGTPLGAGTGGDGGGGGDGDGEPLGMGNMTCPSGWEYSLDFDFKVNAFATRWEKELLYGADVTLVNECYVGVGM
ncbi:hypothetical protein F4778DRAFT_777928 [Xylariomycetidae sp. FL2044]|nr:hypothetical protein F4778DRAFT_777928 [Xylariomycetidae sp. FL2044]